MKYALSSGTDNLKKLETWNRVEELISTFKVMVLKRDNDNMQVIIEQNSILQKYKNSFIELKEIEPIKLSSSYVREKIERGQYITTLIPPEIEEDAKRIYKVKKNK